MSNAAAKKRGLPQQVKMRHDTHFVEDLVGRHPEDAVGRMLAMRLISPDPNQPRSSMGDLGELVESVKGKGVLEPILVRPVDEDDLVPNSRHRGRKQGTVHGLQGPDPARRAERVGTAGDEDCGEEGHQKRDPRP